MTHYCPICKTGIDEEFQDDWILCPQCNTRFGRPEFKPVDLSGIAAPEPVQVSKFVGGFLGVIAGACLAMFLLPFLPRQNRFDGSPELTVLTLPVCLGPLAGMLLIVVVNAWLRGGK